MKKAILMVFLILSADCFAGAKNSQTCKVNGLVYGDIPNVIFVSNYDGDTIKVDIPGFHALFGAGMTVRIYGVDAPELKSKDKCERKKALEAKKLVYGILRNAKKVDLKQTRRDKYFRILANVYADGVDVSQRLMEKKLAYPYFGCSKSEVDWCSN